MSLLEHSLFKVSLIKATQILKAAHSLEAQGHSTEISHWLFIYNCSSLLSTCLSSSQTVFSFLGLITYFHKHAKEKSRFFLRSRMIHSWCNMCCFIKSSFYLCVHSSFSSRVLPVVVPWPSSLLCDEQRSDY